MPSNNNLNSPINSNHAILRRRRQRNIDKYQRRRRALINNASTLSRLPLQTITNDPFANQIFNGSPFF